LCVIICIPTGFTLPFVPDVLYMLKIPLLRHPIALSYAAVDTSNFKFVFGLIPVY
jgi:alkanesulfonate monooxygenase SsuD/methylene tetrahydromethanopterin reductase-like flavin-dependent oxidoreductase (luciferase family)